MNTSKVEICGVNTALLPVLNEEQKTQLLLAAKAGNSEARAQMIPVSYTHLNAPCRQHQIDRWPRSGKNDKLLWRQHHPTQGKTETGWTDNKHWGQAGQQYPHQQVAAFMQAGAQKP